MDTLITMKPQGGLRLKVSGSEGSSLALSVHILLSKS